MSTMKKHKGGHWALYTTEELLNSTSETNDVLYVG